MTQEALKLALEALKAAQELAGKHDAELEYGFQQAIAVIEKALAQRSESSGKPSAWVGLTDEEAMNVTRKEGHELLDFIYEYGTGVEGVEERIVAICKAIEAKVKELNT
jgi:hypothetical protein